MIETVDLQIAKQNLTDVCLESRMSQAILSAPSKSNESVDMCIFLTSNDRHLCFKTMK